MENSKKATSKQKALKSTPPQKGNGISDQKALKSTPPLKEDENSQQKALKSTPPVKGDQNFKQLQAKSKEEQQLEGMSNNRNLCYVISG